MADLLALSSRIIDGSVTDEPVNRVTNELSELADDLAIVESFSHCVALSTDEGLVCFDVSGARTGPAVVRALRTWSEAPVHSIVYTHGHVDHVGGSPAVAADAQERRHPAPEVVGHHAVAARFDRYEATNDFNLLINNRQFGGISAQAGLGIGGEDARFLPEGALRPTRTFSTDDELTIGGERIELHHARGETDDHLWAWLPSGGGSSPATSSSGTSRTPATRRRCSATRSSGPPPCGRWPPPAPSCSCPPTACPSPTPTGSSGCSTRSPPCSSSSWPTCSTR
jgi:glyoxylase-like metal-dependent hydrolase (beta-lactamase superfamily II)